MQPVVAFALFVFVPLLECAAYNLPAVMFGRPRGGRLNVRHPALEGVVRDDYPGLEHHNITQPIDHDDASVGYYSQRYQYNKNYFDPNADPAIVFLMIGGESEATDIWIYANYSYIVWAQKYHAAVFQLEHRFFGHSRPFGDTKTEHLKYLTVHQAMEDVVSFIKAMNDQYKFKNPKWVTFGGSYPGMLDAWFRQKYPELTAGAVASSAPLDIELDSFVYELVIERVLNETSVECKKAFTNAFAELIQKSLTVEGRKELSTKLKLNPPFDEATLRYRDLQNLMANLNMYFQMVVQYTYDGRTEENKNGYDVKHMCQNITGITDNIILLRAFVEWYEHWTFNATERDKPHTFANSYSDMVTALAEDTWKDMSNTEYRTWLWLCCNELGAMVTTDMGRNVFGAMLPINYWVDVCTDIFGPTIDEQYVHEHTNAFKKTYDGCDTYSATNIVLPNGLYDPWSNQGCLVSNTTRHQIAVPMAGAAHCADMYPYYENEPQSVKDAFPKIQKEIEYFIGWKTT